MEGASSLGGGPEVPRRYRILLDPSSSVRGDPERAVLVDNVEFSHGSHQVLKGLTMNVKAGSIYGLTGSSGCGKTTLISCILGIREVDQGSISLYGHDIKNPGTKDTVRIPGQGVGYMPQEISLYTRFTTQEMLVYFGRLMGMTLKKVEDAVRKLLQFLELSERRDVRIEVLSGGEKRRVSFAVALVHSPKMLLLDEPTVGMDPLLRVRIWDYLRQLVITQGVTVIITTHYIEEMRNADRVGVLVDGRIIIENSPASLLTWSNITSLQDTILKICKQSPDSLPVVSPEPPGINNSPGLLHKTGSESRPCVPISRSLDKVVALVEKNFKNFLRNLPLFIFFTLVPPIQLLTSLFPGGHPAHLPFGVINLELQNSSTTEQLICPRYLSTPPHSNDTCNLHLLSCHFLSHLPPETFTLIPFRTESQAITAVAQGHIYGYVHFAPAFSENLVNRAFTQAETGTVDEDLLLASQITVRLDRSNVIQAEYLSSELIKAQQSFLIDLMTACLENPRLGQYPLQYDHPVFGTDGEFNVGQFTAPGSALSFMFFYAIVSCGFRLVEERRSGMWHRLRVAGVPASLFVLADLLSEIVLIASQAVLSLALMLWWVPLHQATIFPVVFTYVMLLLSGCAGASFGFLLGSVLQEPSYLAMIAIACILPNDFLSGVGWPIEAMPLVLQYLSVVLPSTLPSEALRWAWIRGKGLSHWKVWSGPVIYFLYIFLLNCITVYIHKRKR